MPVYKNEDNGTWYVLTRYLDWKGERKQKCKRGFETKREAQEWERVFKQQSAADMDMNFSAFVELYIKDIKPRLKENTWLTKKHIIETKILPYFEKKNVSEITTKDVIAWQNELLAFRDEKKKPYSQTYLKTVHNQLSAIFNHAVRHYDLRSNPAAKAGNMGTEERKEMKFWTKEEYKKFADEMMDKPVSYYLADINRQAEEMFSRLVKQMVEREGVTEQLKADNQMEWVGRMNNIRSRATKVVNTDLIYT